MAAADPSVMCLVPARAGSRRIADKNLAEVGGTTLLEHAVAVGLAAFGRVYVSTDSQRYAEVASLAGAEVPSLRPPSLALDETPVDEVVAHALGWAPGSASTLVLVQPTSPFTTPDDLTGVVAELRRTGAACALLARRMEPVAAYLLEQDTEGLSTFAMPRHWQRRTQDVPALAVPTGGAYAAAVDRLRGGGRLVAEPVATVVVDDWRAVDVDTPEDLELARRVASSGARAVPRGIVLFGGGGHARAVADVIVSSLGSLAAVVDPAGTAIQVTTVLREDHEGIALARRGGHPAAVAIGDGRRRAELVDRLLAAGLAVPPVVSRRATVGADAVIGDGTVVLDGAHLGPGARAGRACIINTGAIVEHDVSLGDGVHVAPGAVVAGGARCGSFVLVGVGGCVLPGVLVGDGAAVGAGAVVTRPVAPGDTVVGVPAAPLGRPS